MSVLLLGEAPTHATLGQPPLEVRTGQRLAQLSGLSWNEYLAIPRRNLFEYPAPSPWDKRAARDAAVHLAPDLRGVRLIALGRRVAHALHLPRDRYLRWHNPPPTGPAARCDLVSILPHPSANRWYNDPRNYDAAAHFLRTCLRPAHRCFACRDRERLGGYPGPGLQRLLHEQCIRTGNER